jgi:hypothetical protein
VHVDGTIRTHRATRTTHDRPGQTGDGDATTVERSRPPSSAAFLTPAELDLELAQPLSSRDDLQKLVDGLSELNGITHVTSDGNHVSFEYDSTQVLPARIRDRLDELGHPGKAGTEVQNPGDTAD